MIYCKREQQRNKRSNRDTLIGRIERAHAGEEMEHLSTFFLLVLVFYTGLTTDTPIFPESLQSFVQPVPLSLSSPQQLLFFPFHSLPSKQN